jgi:hypothetical protein
VGAAFTLTTGVAPDALAGGFVFGDVESDARGLFSPSGRLGVGFAANGAFQSASATFTRTVAHADGCPLRLGPAGGVSLRACVGVDAGFVHAEAIHAPVPSVRDPFWADVTLLGRGRWTMRSLFVELEGGLMLPLTWVTFQTDSAPPNAPGGTLGTVYKVPPAAAVASIGAGLRFP